MPWVPGGGSRSQSVIDPDGAVLPVAVVIPALNRAHMIGVTLDSVFSQTPMSAAEVIVVDDGSDDETAAAAEACGARVVRHSENLGPAAARNSGMRATDQPWVAFLDSDDVWLPNHLSVLWGEHAGRLLVGSSCLAWDEVSGQPTRVLGPLTRKPRLVRLGTDLLFPENFISQSAALVDRQAAITVGGYDPSRRKSEDLHLWMRLIAAGPAVALPDVTVRYRVHPDQTVVEAKEMRRSHLAAMLELSELSSDARLIERIEASNRWDDFRSAQRDGRLWDATVNVMWLLRPRRLSALGRMLARRFRSRRWAYRFSSDGGPSAALLSSCSSVPGECTRVVDLRGRSTLFVALALVSKPPGVVVGGNAGVRILARLLNVTVVKAAYDD